MAATDTVVMLPPLRIETLVITLIGDTPLIVHNWSFKQKEAMLAKQMKKASAGKEAKNPVEDFKSSMYLFDGDKHGFPVIAFKSAAVTACTSIGSMTKVAARQAFHVEGVYAEIIGCEPTMREDMVRVGMGTADLRYRAEYQHWATQLVCKYNANLLSSEQILNLFNTAGFAVGVGEWRPERDGQNGRFHVASREELAAFYPQAKAA